MMTSCSYCGEVIIPGEHSCKGMKAREKRDMEESGVETIAQNEAPITEPQSNPDVEEPETKGSTSDDESDTISSSEEEEPVASEEPTESGTIAQISVTKKK